MGRCHRCCREEWLDANRFCCSSCYCCRACCGIRDWGTFAQDALNKVSEDLAAQTEYYEGREKENMLKTKDFTNKVQSHLTAAADLPKAARNGTILPQPAVIEQILHDAGGAAEALMKVRADCEEYQQAELPQLRQAPTRSSAPPCPHWL
jgi:hypothetical protein